MKRTLIFLSIILLSNLSIAQNDIETLEKMYNMVENDRAMESKAKDLVTHYYYGTKEKVREKSDKLTQEEFDSLNERLNMGWGQITDAIRNSYSNSYNEFYSRNRDFLEEWREGILDRLYKYIYNSKTIEKVETAQVINELKSSYVQTATVEQIKRAEFMFKNYLPKLLKSKGDDASIYNKKTLIGDFTGDGVDDIIIWFVYGFGGTAIGGVEATFYEVKNNGVKVVAGYSPQHRFVIERIENGVVYATKILYAKDDSQCCPSINIPIQLYYANNKIDVRE